MKLETASVRDDVQLQRWLLQIYVTDFLKFTWQQIRIIPN